MVEPESPRVPFEILMRRFKEMPEQVVYDNCCHLHTYCLKREPVRFQHTQFRVDRFHFNKNHTSCSLGYSLDTYSADPIIASMNSSVCEQANKDLRRLSTSASCMSPENLIVHAKIYLAIRNMYKHFNKD